MSGSFWNWRIFPCAAAGLLYGIILAVAGMGAAGAGHGTSAVIELSSSPLGLFQNMLVAWIGAPVLWCFAGFWLGGVTHRVGNAIFLTTMLAHYGGLLFIMRSPSTFWDWGHARTNPELVGGSIAIYVAGQIALWVTFFVILSKGKIRREEITP